MCLSTTDSCFIDPCAPHPVQGWQSRRMALSDENHGILVCENRVRKLLAAKDIQDTWDGDAGGVGPRR